MAWSKKTWVQRIVENVGRRLLTPTTDANVFDITRSEGTIIQPGDGFTVSNMNDLENRIDSGFSDASTATGAVDTKVGVLASLTTDIKTNIVSAINWIVTQLDEPKQAPTGTKVVVATSLTAGNTFTAPANGVYQVKVSFTANTGYIISSQSNGEQYQVNSAPSPAYGQVMRVPVNTNQILTIAAVNSISTVELAFFPMA